MKASADSKKSSRPSAGNSSSMNSNRCRRPLAWRSSVRRRPIWLRIKSHQRLGAADVRWRYDEIQRRWPFVLNEISDAPVAAPRHLGNDGVAIEPEERHRGREHAGSFVFALVQYLPRRG